MCALCSKVLSERSHMSLYLSLKPFPSLHHYQHHQLVYLSLAYSRTLTNCSRIETGHHYDVRLLKDLFNCGVTNLSLSNHASSTPSADGEGCVGLLFQVGGYVHGSNQTCWRFLQACAVHHHPDQSATAGYGSGAG